MKHDSGGQVFDISKPHAVSPDATSRPIIVGHKPTMNDPMVNEEQDSEVPTMVNTRDEPTPSDPLPAEVPSSTDWPEPHHEGFQTDGEQPPEPDDIDKALATNLFSEAHHETPGPGTQFTPAASADEPRSVPDIQEHVMGHPAAPLVLPAGKSRHHRWLTRLLFWLGLLILLGMLVYALLDARLVKTNLDLPFHIFKQETADPAPVTKAPTSSKITQSTVAAGFTEYSLPNTPVKMVYPTAWGTPTVTSEEGFSKRGGTNKSDGSYAYLLNFATNKDVQIALTSGKYLPASRAATYYDFLQWCEGTNDKKIYKSLLHYTTADGVDTPTTITCDQGPLTDATEIDELTIVQPGTRGVDGSELGDLYTRNLKFSEVLNTDLVVVRVKDAAKTNGDDIKKLLSGVRGECTSDCVIPN